MNNRRSTLLRLAQLLLLLMTLIGVSFAALGEAARRSQSDPMPESSSFHDKVQTLRRLSAETAVTQRLIESLDELDDLQLTRLRAPKQALEAAGGKARRLHAGYGGEAHPGQRRSLAAYP